MVIEDNRTTKETTFEELKNGDIFMYNDGYFIKALHNMNNVDNYRNAYGHPANALDLDDGTLVDFEAKDMVIPVNGKVVIK